MEWMCAECGAPHPKNDPPCKNCGAMRFEKTVVRRRPDDESNPASVEWKCTECGRTHPKNSPPCSRCGNMQLESVEANQFDADEISGGLGILDAAKFVGALVVIGVLVLGFANGGVLTQGQAPAVENVPGEANYSSGLELDTAEYEIYEGINEERASEGLETLSLDPKTTNVAEYHNKLMVKRGEYPLDEFSADTFDKFGSCSNRELAYNRLDYGSDTDQRAIDYYSTEEELAREFVGDWLGNSETRPILLDSSASSVGVDVHVSESGAVYATVTFC